MESTVRVNTKQIRLVLKMPRLFGFRMRLTTKLIQLAGLISPVTIEIEHGND